MKIGILFDGLELPPKNGVTFRFHYLTQALKRKGVNIVPFFCNRGWVNNDDLKKQYGHVHLFSPNIFYNKIEFVKEKIKSENVDLIQVNNSASVLRFGSYYSSSLNIPLITEMHDCDATIKKTIGANKDVVNKMKFFQYAAGIISHAIITMTEKDKNELELLGIPKHKLNLISNGIDTAYFPYSKPNIKSKQIIFLGNMFYSPNLNAAEILITKIMPNVDLKLVCVGMVPEKFKKQHTSFKVSFTNGIDDIRPLLKKSILAVAPIFQGSGMKVKMLNFAAAGIPIVTTSVGISGYPPNFAIVENDIKQYPKLIKKLINNPEKISTQSIIAHKIVKDNFMWGNISNTVINLYKNTKYTDFPNIVDRKISNKTEVDPYVYFSEKSPLPMWLEEDRLKFTANVLDYIEI